MNNTQKLFSILFLNLTLSVPTYAKAIEQKALNFDVQSEKLMKGEEHFSFKIVSPAQLSKKFPEFKGLDSLALQRKHDVKIILSKSAYVVKQPVGNFDHQHVVDEKFLQHQMGVANVKKMDEDSFKISSPKLGYTYEVATYFDSDDVSTLSNSNAIQAVTTSKKLDVIVQSAPSTVFSESTRYSKFFDGAVSIAAYAPLKESKTLVVVYKLIAVKKKFADAKLLKPLFLQDLLDQKSKTESYDFKK